MGITVQDEKEIPDYLSSDANKVLKLDSSGIYYQWLAETSEIPTQTGNSGKYLTTDGTTPSWGTVSQVPSQTGATSGSLLQTNGTTASWTNTPTVSVINTGTGALTGIKWGNNTGVDGTTTGVNLRVGGVTIVGVSSNTVTSTGVINITHTGSAANPSLSFGDRGVAGSLTGIYANPVDDNINFATNSTERVKINNSGLTVNNNLILAGSNSNYAQLTNSMGIIWGPNTVYPVEIEGFWDTADPDLSYFRINMPEPGNTATNAENVRFNAFNSYFWKPIIHTKAPGLNYTIHNSNADMTINNTSTPVVILKGTASAGQTTRLIFPASSSITDGSVTRVIVRSKFASGGHIYLKFSANTAALMDGSTTPTIYSSNTDISLNAGEVYDVYNVYNGGTGSEYILQKLVM